MRIIFESKNGKKFTWRPTKWQKIVGYAVTTILFITNIYLAFGYGYINSLG